MRGERKSAAIWKSIHDRAAASAKQQEVIEKLQQPTAQLGEAGVAMTQQGYERLAQMETSISAAAAALSTTQLGLGTRSQVVYEAVEYTPARDRAPHRQ